MSMFWSNGYLNHHPSHVVRETLGCPITSSYFRYIKHLNLWVYFKYKAQRSSNCQILFIESISHIKQTIAMQVDFSPEPLFLLLMMFHPTCFFYTGNIVWSLLTCRMFYPHLSVWSESIKQSANNVLTTGRICSHFASTTPWHLKCTWPNLYYLYI